MTDTAYAYLTSGISGRTLAQFGAALEEMAKYEEAGFLLKVQHEGIKFSISNAFEQAWSKLIKERYTYAGKWQSLSEAERKLEQALFHPYPHVVAGYLKKAQAATKADGAMRNDMIRLLEEMLPVAERLMALKDKIGKRNPATTKTALAAAERAAKAMTCQCCGRDILAETGTIAHHGYERPAGMGFQTASCYGAKELPFEVSRDALGRYIADLEAYVIRQDALRSRIQAESQDITFTYADRSGCTQPWQRGIEKSVLVNRATFAQVLEETREARLNATQPNPHRQEPEFDKLKAHRIAQITGDIESTERHIDAQRTRWIRWKPTHKREADAWVKLEEA